MPAILTVILCAGSGALVHHLTETGAGKGGRRPAVRGEARAGAGAAHTAGALVAGHPAKDMVEALLEITDADEENLDWARLEQYLDGMAPGDYLLVLRTLTEMNSSFFGGGERERLLQALVERAAAADTAGLLAFAEENVKAPEGGAMFYDRLYQVARACFASQPDAVLASVQRLRESAENAEQGQRYVEATVGRLLGDAGDRLGAVMQALARAGYFDHRLASPEEPEGTALSWMLQASMEQWAGQDRTAALAFAELHPPLLSSVLRKWAAEDLGSALAWLDGSPGRRTLAFPETASKSMDDLYNAYALTHPVEAERYADQAGDLSRFHLCQANGMAHEPPEAAAAWLRALPESERGSVATQVLGQFQTDTAAQTAQLMDFLKAYPEAWMYIKEKTTVESMAAHHPEALAQQVAATASLPEPQRLETLRWIMDGWQELDSAAATAFLQTLPPSEMQGRLLMENSQILTDETREAARAYALSLPDPSQRLGAARVILKDITGNEPSAEEARAFIELGAVVRER